MKSALGLNFFKGLRNGCTPTFFSNSKVLILSLSLVGGKDCLVHANITLSYPGDSQLSVLISNLILSAGLDRLRDIVDDTEPVDLCNNSTGRLVDTEDNSSSFVGLTGVDDL